MSDLERIKAKLAGIKSELGEAISAVNAALKSEKDAQEKILGFDKIRTRLDRAENLLRSALCDKEGCRNQAECFAGLNEGSHRELICGCKEHMPSLVMRRSLLTPPRHKIVEATLLDGEEGE